jgi:hypothetical protein
MDNNKVEVLYAKSPRTYYNSLNIHNPSKNVLIIDDFIVHVSSTIAQIFILKKINGEYREVGGFSTNNNRVISASISYLGKQDDNINFLIKIKKCLYVYEEKKEVTYKAVKSKYDYWNITKISGLSDIDYDITTSENGLIFAKSQYFNNIDNVIHVYRYTQKIATISLTDAEKQLGGVFGAAFSCNSSGTFMASEKIIQKSGSSFSVYKIANNKIELLYTVNDKNIIDIYNIKYSPCGDFIEFTYFPRASKISMEKNIYSALHKQKCLETQNMFSTFNNTGFLHAEYTETEDKKNIIIRCCANEEMQIKTIINCTNTILKIIFSPNSQLVATMEKNNADQVVIKVYRIFKLQQNDNIEFAPMNSEDPTEVFAEINTEDIVDLKFHPDGFKIIVITKKIIRIFCLTKE